MSEDNSGCRSTIIMTILTIIAIAMLLSIGTLAAPLDTLPVTHEQRR